MIKRLIYTLLLLIISMQSTKAFDMKNLFRSKPYPEVFFEGEQLAIAEAIKSKDVNLIQKHVTPENINEPGVSGMTLLSFAVYDENREAISALIKLGADASIEVPKQGNAMYTAITRKSTKTLEALLEAGVSPNTHNEDQSMLVPAMEFKQKKHVDVLLKAGIDVNHKDNLGNTPLLETLMGMDYDNAELLLNHGADGHATTHDALTIAYSVQQAIGRVPRESEGGQILQRIKQKLVEQGVGFPALPPHEERKKRGIVWCDEPEGWVHESECKVVGTLPSWIKQ